MDTSFSPTPMTTKATPAKFFAFGGTLFVAIAALMFAIVLPKTNTNDQSKAALATSCAGSTVVPAAICGEKCIVNEDCTSGLTCYKLDLFSVCRNPQNLTSATCTTPTSTVPSSNPTTKPGTTATPTPPAGCTYQQVQCIQAPCDPILVCTKTIKIVKDNTSGWIDIDAINENGGLTQQTSTRFAYTGSWATDTNAVYNGGSSTYTGTPGATVTFATTASTLKLMTTRATNRASFDVYVNGVKKATLSTINATRQDQYVIDLSAYLQ